jgi:hypothetical protein
VAIARRTTYDEIPIVDASDEQQLRELAIKQSDRTRRFRRRVLSYAVASIVLVTIWATTEYNDAGGWPTSGFSQSSSVHHVWNDWIIYPIVGLVLALAIDAWNTFGRRPITEGDVRREMDRLNRAH